VEGIRWIGMLISMVVGGYAIYGHRAGRYRRLGLLIRLCLVTGVIVLLLDPSSVGFLWWLCRPEDWWLAALAFFNLVILGLLWCLVHNLSITRRQLGAFVRGLARHQFEMENERGSMEGAVAVVIPAYNEESTIPGVLSTLPVEVLGYPLVPIVIVDGASDSTERLVRDAGHMVASHLLNRGQGDALRTGFEIALAEGAIIVVTMDADGQHRPQDLLQLIAPVVNAEADYVMGSRFLGEYEDRGGARHVGIICFSWLIRVLTGLEITDCTNGLRAIRASQLQRLELREDRFNAPELIIEAARKGLRICEVPVSILSRAEGESKKPGRLRYALGFARTIIATWLR